MEDSPSARFVGIDLHKHFVVVAAVNVRQEVVLPPTRRIDLDDFPAWAQAHLQSTDVVVLESTSNAWWLHDLIAPLVARCVVANSLKVKWIASSAVKTDRQDALRLAKLLAANLIPPVWVPPPPVRELRALIAHRQALVKHRTAVKNRLHSVLHRQHIAPPPGDPFARQNREWWQGLNLSSTERLRVDQDLATLDHLEKQLADLEAELARLSAEPPWSAAMPYLLQIPGLALISAMTILAAVGDISRFPSPKHLVSYAGLAPRVHRSGEMQRDGPISKEGRQDFRRVLIEAAWVAVRTHPYWRQEFARLSRRKSQGVAIVAIARRLLVAIWHVLYHCVADRHAEPTAVACKLMRWSQELTPEHRGGLTTAQFVRYGLLRLGLGHDLTGFTYGGMPRRLAPVEEMLERFPELSGVL